MLVFLKLGGSLITDKNRPHTAFIEIIDRLAEEISNVWNHNSEIQILLGHGSGSFGHYEGRKFGTREGVKDRNQWFGFTEVWRAARSLDQIVLDRFSMKGLPVISFPPSSTIVAEDGRITSWDVSPIHSALNNRIIPMVYGDVAFDRVRGGTILSTEDLFFYLAHQLKPVKVFLAGKEEGVWGDFPTCHELINKINTASTPLLSENIGKSIYPDVTGGMAQKVKIITEMVELNPGIRASIFSGLIPGNVEKVISGSSIGTEVFYSNV